MIGLYLADLRRRWRRARLQRNVDRLDEIELEAERARRLVAQQTAQRRRVTELKTEARHDRRTDDT